IWLAGLERPHLERAVFVSHTLARQQIGLALEILPPRRLGPPALHPPARQPCLARAARAGATFVGHLDAPAHPPVTPLLARLSPGPPSKSRVPLRAVTTILIRPGSWRGAPARPAPRRPSPRRRCRRGR